MSYKQTAAEVLKYVGGNENVSHLEHCSTRLRFSLNDNSKANVDQLKKIPGVMAVKMNAQCQVVIGNEVVEVYDEVKKLLVPNEGATNANSQHKPKQKQKIGSVILDFVVGIFQPLVPAIAGGGILKSLLLLLSVMGLMDPAGQTYQILNMIGDAPLYFLPLLVAVTTANKLKVNSLVALSAVGALVLPNMAAMIGEGAQLFSFNIENIAYTYQVFPAILTILFYAQVEKLFTKISPKPIRIFFVPMISLLITVPIALLVLGPIGFTFGQGLSAVILAIFDKVGWIAVALLATVLPLMVATGMHKAMVPYAVTTMSELGKEILYLPASLAHNLAESGACFAVAIRTKDKVLKSTAISAGISALFGITEPALYGVTIQNKKVLSSVMIGSFVGGTFIGIAGLQAFVLVGPGLASLSMFISEELPNNIINAIIGLVLSFGVAFVAAFLLGKDKSVDKKVVEDQRDQVTKNFSKLESEFKSPLVGQMVNLSDVNDEVFSSKVMGDGIAIIPSKGELYAPTDGKIEMIFETNHALGLTTDQGAQILFHVGLNTVQLAGKYFEPQVKVGDEVKTGDLLLKFDLEKIKEEFDPVTIAVVTSKENYTVKVADIKQVEPKDTLMYISTLGY
ncbi:beta-glucoside-specific PTS transporter subunit IIABC [Bacillales bacterium AN1005]|uniref:beta-glucoside-specific PTS transporter subunit IIABC n=1 Tax=Niallia taxi TaxID=2499688 RepID=UPI0021A327E7|nr:beta-glucoside-specific PTS transporter subunit IIABC [Niallia taxi]MCT2344587.1 beta-glucoside-specific PTS transporter subunit IIABC [Niallia taxi]MED3960956.1 beta-glucoside-specific PTS transporter subunit IIABC [Niallia taxi]